jgi:antitoxin component YwqK of YwqJK toxin-antitoxin module
MSLLDEHPHGDYELYYRNGILHIKCTYTNGLKNGILKEYNDKGKIIATREYINGKFVNPNIVNE